MLYLACFIAGVCVGVSICSLIVIHSRFEQRRREHAAHMARVQQKIDAADNRMF